MAHRRATACLRVVIAGLAAATLGAQQPRDGGPASTFTGTIVGTVTSGTQTPFIKRAIGMAYVPNDLRNIGTEIDIDVRGRVSKARIVALPFYSRTGV